MWHGYGSQPGFAFEEGVVSQDLPVWPEVPPVHTAALLYLGVGSVVATRQVPDIVGNSLLLCTGLAAYVHWGQDCDPEAI